MKHRFLFFIGLFLGFLFAVPLFGQADKKQDGVFERKTQFRMTGDSVVSFYFYEVRDSTAFRNLKVKNEHFPVSILKKPVLDPFFDLVQGYEAQLFEYRNLDKQQRFVDSVQVLKIQKLEQVVALQKERVDNYRQLTDDLCQTNSQLSQQLNNAVNLTEKQQKNRRLKMVWTGILGGAVGFSVASLIALVKNN